MKMLIVAAGQGTRLRAKGESKPLIPLRGVPLIERVIRNAVLGGIDDFYVVSGYRGDELRGFLDELASRENIKLTHIINEDWEKANGLSVHKAKGVIDGDFILSMCDHLVDPEIFRAVSAEEHATDTVTLCVDYNITNPMIDLEDVTRVQCTPDKIDHIGKIIKDYNAFDTGVFYCTSKMFEALEESASRGDESISGAMNVLGEWNLARTFDIQGRLWLDVDDPVAFEKAEKLIHQGRF